MRSIFKFQLPKQPYPANFGKGKINKGGFSLIELLISITIVGIIATVVLQSVSRSRERAYDSKIKQQLNSFRTAAEIYYNNQEPNNYSNAIGCTGGMFNDFSQDNGTPGIYIALGNLPSGTQESDRACQSNGSSYAVKVNLYSNNNHWCVDNRGFSGEVVGPIVGPTTICS